ncbi:MULTISPECIES: hypothetical protein [Methanobacterium]|uniref:Uncharacterized protein n=1 Tax=Methanobacterium veterum TaxID=408577 RepID=A0A9E5A414_9EURY|nr:MULTISPECIES: hypothetical protein [Methanobacterium]MCZ3366661.1 hypothetical protein [Methanobacterium veterum]MCZ3374194.1 hypothetical protein [Methanobacterium veterum]
MITEQQLRQFKAIIYEHFQASKDKDNLIDYLVHNFLLDNYEIDDIIDIINVLSDQHDDLIRNYEDAICPIKPNNYNEMFPTLTEDKVFELSRQIRVIFQTETGTINYNNVLYDYTDEVKDIAIKIYENGKAPEYLQKYLESNHIGDKDEIKIILTDIFTPHISNSQINHIDVGGSAESGKTRLTNTVSKIIPDKYLTVVKTVSPKYLFYKDDWNERYNYIIVQDSMDSEIINLMKTATDPENVGDVSHRTVIDKKAVTLTIEGKVMVILTHAKDLVDIELNSRLRSINPDESEEHSKQVKNMLKLGFGQSETKDDKYRKIAQAIFELLTVNEFKVFNPYLQFLDVTTMGKRDVKMFRNTLNALTFLNQKSRDITTEGILIGTYEDFKLTKDLWNKYQYHQQYKANDKQLRILELLPTLPDDETLSKNPNIIKDGLGYNEIAKEIKVSPSTVKSWIHGRTNDETQSEKLGLRTQELVDILKVGNSSNGKAYVFRTEKGEELANSRAVTAVTSSHKRNATADFTPFDEMPNIKTLIYNYIIAVTGKESTLSDITKVFESHNIENKTLANDEQIFNTISEIETKGIINEIININNYSILDQFIDTQVLCDSII